MGTSLRLKERVAVITFYPNYHKPLESKGNKELLLTIKYRLKKEMKVPWGLYRQKASEAQS